MPIRPFMAYNCSPKHKTEKWLHTDLSGLCDQQFEYSIGNTFALVINIKNIQFDQNDI